MDISSQEIEAIVKQVLAGMGGAQTSAAPAAYTAAPGGAAGDRGVFENVDDAVEAAWKAQRDWAANYKIEDRQRIIEAIRRCARAHVEEWCHKIVEETGMGRYEDKVEKHLAVINKTPGPECLTTEAKSGDAGLMLEEYAPFGVICSITPTTNPTETITFEIIPEEEITAVARYPFDETAGTTAANTIYGQAAAEGFTPEWSTGHSGNAITFPATAAETSRLTQASYPELAGLSDNPFTIALWIKAEKADQNLLNIEGDNGSYIRIEMNKTFSFSISDGTETTKAALRSTTLFNNEWNQLICIRDREDGKLYLYINGERKANISDKCGDLEISRITIGNRTEGDTHLPFRGMLDELVISTGAMNERQVEEYYQKTSAGITETAASSHEDPVQVYPTRFTDQLQLRFKNTESRRTNIVLYNNAGTAVFEREYNTQGLPRLVISGLEALPKGSYTLTISQDGKPLPAKKLFKW